MPRPTYVRLTREEEYALIRRIQKGDRAAANDLASRVFPYVRHIANKYPSHAHAFDDLVSAGCQGMMRAMVKFQISKGKRFSTYAAFWIHSYIGRYIQMHHQVVHRPLREHAGLHEDFSLDVGKRGEDLDTTWLDDMVSEYDSPEAVLAAKYDTRERDGHIERAMSPLLERERIVIMCRYYSDDPETHAQIGLRLGGLSREYVRLVEKKAIEKMRRYFTNHNIPFAA